MGLQRQAFFCRVCLLFAFRIPLLFVRLQRGLQRFGVGSLRWAESAGESVDGVWYHKKCAIGSMIDDSFSDYRGL
jgi:hypothetical protein